MPRSQCAAGHVVLRSRLRQLNVMRMTALLVVLAAAGGGPLVSAQLEVMEVGSLIRTGRRRCKDGQSRARVSLCVMCR